VGRRGAPVTVAVPGDPEGATYAYRAARADGAMEIGTLAAASREQAAAQLAARRLFPVELTAERLVESRRARLAPADLALGLRMLATLLESGLPVGRALSAFEPLAPGAWRSALPVVREAVREGQSLATALSRAPVEVPPVVVGIVQAGEAGSGLATAVRRAADLTEASAATRAAVRNALAYPLILAGAGAASLALMVGVVLPRFAVILADLGQQLPPTTRLVLAAASAVRTLTLPALAVAVVGSVAWRAWVATAEGRERWHGMLLASPVVGPVRQAAATARVAAALGALLESGVPIAPALLHAARAAGDAAVGARLLATRDAVITGQGLARSLAATNAVTPTAVRLVRAGEESGRVAAMLAHTATLEGERAAERVKATVRLLEPALILAFGGLIAFVAAALLQAVYSVRPTG